jgi:hypothetical protein
MLSHIDNDFQLAEDISIIQTISKQQDGKSHSPFSLFDSCAIPIPAISQIMAYARLVPGYGGRARAWWAGAIGP